MQSVFIMRGTFMGMYLGLLGIALMRSSEFHKSLWTGLADA